MIWERVYSFAKIKAKEGNLLINKWDEIKNYSYFGLIKILADHKYITFTAPEELDKPYLVEYEIRLKEAETLVNLEKTYPKKLKPIIEAFLTFIDIYNLKIAYSFDKEKANYLIPTKVFNKNIIKQLKDGNFEIIKQLPYYAETLREAEIKALTSLAKKLPYDIGKFIIDTINIRLKLLGEKIFIKGGTLTKEDIENINSIEDVGKVLKEFEGIKDEKEFEERYLEILEKKAREYLKYNFLDDRPFIGFPILLDIDATKVSALLTQKWMEENLKRKNSNSNE